MFLNNLLYSKGECVQPENEKKAVHLLLLFGLSLQSLSLLQNWLTFFVQDAHIPYALRCTYVYWYHFLPHVQHWNRFNTQYIKQNLTFPGFLNEFEFITARIAKFYTIFIFLWGGCFWIVRHLFCDVLFFFYGANFTW